MFFRFENCFELVPTKYFSYVLVPPKMSHFARLFYLTSHISPIRSVWAFLKLLRAWAMCLKCSWWFHLRSFWVEKSLVSPFKPFSSICGLVECVLARFYPLGCSVSGLKLSSRFEVFQTNGVVGKRFQHHLQEKIVKKLSRNTWNTKPKNPVFE